MRRVFVFLMIFIFFFGDCHFYLYIEDVGEEAGRGPEQTDDAAELRSLLPHVLVLWKKKEKKYEKYKDSKFQKYDALFSEI